MIVDTDPVEISNIEIDPNYTTRSIKSAKNDIDSLASSIQKVGLLQPITVTAIAYKKYKLISGQRRLLACKKLGWKEIPASTVFEVIIN